MKHPELLFRSAIVKVALFVASAVTLTATAANAAPGRVLMDVTDPARDDHGPGDYQYPMRNDYRRGDLDLRRFILVDEGDHIRFEVRFARVIQPILEPRRSRMTIVPLDNQVTVQNVDIYLQAPNTEPKSTEGIPGRQIAFSSRDGWTRAVVFTPQPGYARHLLKPWTHSPRVIVPNNLQGSGRRVWARVPVADLGGRPGPGWGVAVVVSGALWENRFRFYRGSKDPEVVNVFTVPVHVLPDWRRFGGGDISGAHPNVLDILAADEKFQRKVLNSYDPKTGAWAQVPLHRL